MPGDGPLPYVPVKRRLVLFFPGFEPLGAEAHRDRFDHAAAKTGKAFDVEFSCSQLSSRPSGLPGFSVDASGENWSTQTDVAVFDWSAILDTFARRNVLIRLVSGIAALFVLLGNGTVANYMRTSWRYGFFYLYPFLLLAASAAIGAAAAAATSSVTSSALPPIVVGILATAAAVFWASRQAHLLLMMDDWHFAIRLARKDNQAIEAVKFVFSAQLAAECASGHYDEVLVIGHSLGCVFAVDSLSSSSVSGDHQPSLMTIGSSLFKIALQPKAGWLRHSISTLTTANVKWLDIQALTDVISFYRSNPASSAGITTGLRPNIQRIHFKDMLLETSYRRNRRNFFKTHRQFVLGNEKRYFYSMHMIACGPLPFAMIWADGGIPDHDALVENGFAGRRPR